MTVSFSESGRPPLRVYLAGPADSGWRLTLIRAEDHEAYTVAARNGARDVVLPGALPYGHTLVGPFQVRQCLSTSELIPKEFYELTRAQHLQNVERWRMRAIAKADIVFAWCPSNEYIPPDLGAELGLAYGTGKAVILASDRQETLEYMPLLTELAWKIVLEKTALAAYERITADLDVTFERGMARIESKYGGQCAFCRSSYKVGEIIYWSKPKGGMHIDCFSRLHREGADYDAVVFNAELVHALRTENADLERECLNLMTKNSMLEQEKMALKEQIEDLQRSFEATNS